MNDHHWRIEYTGGREIVSCTPLDSVPGLLHAFSTRTDGDMGGPDDPGDARRQFLESAGFGSAIPVVLKQVHGKKVIPCSRPGRVLEADGFFLGRNEAPGVAPSIRTADCVPVILADREGTAAAVVHAGWRGTAAGIAEVALRKLTESGVNPGRIVAALGPAIGPCCYEVGPEVLAAVGEEAEAPGYLDLHAVLRHQIVAAGVPAESVFASPWCTGCDSGLFFSYRREGAAAGRQMVSITFRPGASP